MRIKDPSLLEPFKALLKAVVEKSSIRAKFENFEHGHLKQLSKEVSSEGGDLVVKPNTLRDYRDRCAEIIPFAADTTKLDILCQFLGYWDWADFLQQDFGIEERGALQNRWQHLKQIIANCYLDEKFTKILLGSIHSSLEPFHVGDFYVDLSYVDQAVMKNSVKLSIKEKEQYRKVQRESIFRVSEQLSEPIIEGNERVVLMGNPGVGKSVFCRFLCWQWSQKLVEKDNMYLHIVLREIDFNVDSNPLMYYLQSRYFKNSNPASVEALVKTHVKKTIYVLDGYDELEFSKKIKLFEFLNEIGSSTRFILSSRPYGLIDLPVYADTTLEIVGFNDQNRLLFIDNAFERIADTSYVAADLTKLLQKNPLLDELSYNPLMMSYIMLICKNETGIQLLENIQSSFQLHETFLNFQKSRYESSKQGMVKFLPKLESGYEVALHMELDQEYVYNCYSSFDPKREPCTEISEIGLGRLQQLDEHFWSFYFSSAPLQEYMASRFLLPHLSGKMILLLLKNQFYWNLCRILIAGLSAKGEEKKTIEILDEIWNESKESNSETLHNLYWILLSECDEKTINQLTTSSKIADLQNVLYGAINSIWWRMLIYDSAAGILSKLEKSKESELINRLLVGFKVVRGPHNHFHTSKACELLHLDTKVSFLNKLIVVVSELLDEYRIVKTKERTEDQLNTLNALSISIRSIFKTLKDTNPKVLQGLAPAISNIVEKASADFLKEVKALTLKIIGDPLLMLSDLEQLIDQYEDNQHTIQNNEKLTTATQKSIGVFDQYTEHQSTVRSLIGRFTACSLKKSDQELSISERETFGSLLRHPEILSQKVKGELLLKFSGYFNVIHEAKIDLEALVAVVDQEIEMYERDSSRLESLSRIGSLLKVKEVGFRAYPIFIDRLFDLTLNMIQENEALLAKILDSYLQQDYDFLDESPVAKWIEEMLALPQFNFEKKILTKRLYDERKINEVFIRKYCLPQILGRDAAFYDKETWTIVRYLLQGEIDSAVDVLTILANEDLYHFHQNIPELDTTIHLLCNSIKDQNLSSHEYARSQIYLLNRITFFTCQLISSSKSKDVDRLLMNLGTLMGTSAMLDYFSNPEETSSEVVEIVFAPLVLYHLSKDRNVLSLMESSGIYRSSELELEENGVAELLKIISMEELGEYKELFSDKLFDEVIKYETIVYTPKKFESEQVLELLN